MANDGFTQDIELRCGKCGAKVVVRVAVRPGQPSHSGHTVYCPASGCGERLPGKFPGRAVVDVFVVES